MQIAIPLLCGWVQVFIVGEQLDRSQSQWREAPVTSCLHLILAAAAGFEGFAILFYYQLFPVHSVASFLVHKNLFSKAKGPKFVLMEKLITDMFPQMPFGCLDMTQCASANIYICVTEEYAGTSQRHQSQSQRREAAVTSCICSSVYLDNTPRTVSEGLLQTT